MNHSTTFRLTATAAFLGLMVAFDMLGIGLIPLGIVNITSLCVLVVTGTIILGFKSGLLLGACFGVLSTLNAFSITRAASALVAPLVSRSPLLVVVLCMLPRLCVPITTFVSYRLLTQKAGGRAFLYATPIAAVLGSLTNTILYLGLMLLIYVATGLDAEAVLGTIAAIAGGAGIGEAVAAGVIATPIVAAIKKLPAKI